MDFLGFFDRELAGRRFAACDAYSVADITGMIAIDFLKPAKLAVPAELQKCRALARRGVGAAKRQGVSLGPDRANVSLTADV